MGSCLPRVSLSVFPSLVQYVLNSRMTHDGTTQHVSHSNNNQWLHELIDQRERERESKNERVGEKVDVQLYIYMCVCMYVVDGGNESER